MYVGLNLPYNVRAHLYVVNNVCDLADGELISHFAKSSNRIYIFYLMKNKR